MSKYSELLKDPRWQRKRLEILQRDNWTCRQCGSTEDTLHVHHHYYEKGKKPWEYDDRILITLCEGCHYLEEVCRQGESDIYKELCISGWTRQQIGVISLTLDFDTRHFTPLHRRKFLDALQDFVIQFGHEEIKE